jgi:predicted transcriptional regulator
MEVHFTPEQEAQLFRFADHTGTDAEALVKNAALRFIEERERFATAVREGVQRADQGELLDDEEVRLWLEDRERN